MLIKIFQFVITKYGKVEAVINDILGIMMKLKDLLVEKVEQIQKLLKR